MNQTPSGSIIPALHEMPCFAVGSLVRIGTRAPIGHYRVPRYLRGTVGAVVQIIEPALIDNEEEGFGSNAGGTRRHYYRVAIPMRALWKNYTGSPRDELRIEIFETWLEQA